MAVVGLRSGCRGRVKAAIILGAVRSGPDSARRYRCDECRDSSSRRPPRAGDGHLRLTRAALAWHLEAETGSDDETPVKNPTPAPEPAGDDTPDRTPALTFRERLVGTASAYFRLMKPRLMWLLCLVAAPGWRSPPGRRSRPTCAATLGGGVLSIGASGTFNHVLERDVDRRMQRTSDRPLAVDLVPVRNAVAFGLLLTVASLWLFWPVNALVAVLGLTAP